MNKREIVAERIENGEFTKDNAREVLAKHAADDKPLSNRDVEVISNALFCTGKFPAGIDDCFVNGTMGRCGKNCTAYGSHPECKEDTDEG